MVFPHILYRFRHRVRRAPGTTPDLVASPNIACMENRAHPWHPGAQLVSVFGDHGITAYAQGVFRITEWVVKLSVGITYQGIFGISPTDAISVLSEAYYRNEKTVGSLHIASRHGQGRCLQNTGHRAPAHSFLTFSDHPGWRIGFNCADNAQISSPIPAPEGCRRYLLPRDHRPHSWGRPPFRYL